MKKTYKSFAHQRYPERQNLASIFSQTLIQILIDLNFANYQVCDSIFEN